jgi:hypothetical protein
MEIWIITDKNGKYIRAFLRQTDAFKFWNTNKNEYEVQQSWAD